MSKDLPSLLVSASHSDRLNQTKSNHFSVLGLHIDASEAEVKAAYHQKLREAHPDSLRGDVFKASQKQTPSISTVEHFKQILAAWKTLSDPGLRRDYTRSLLHGSLYSQNGAIYNLEKSVQPFGDEQDTSALRVHCHRCESAFLIDRRYFESFAVCPDNKATQRALSINCEHCSTILSVPQPLF